jgi:uncharacterized protein (DUF433 family)
MHMDQAQETFTPSEAAAISGLALRSVQREIDEGQVRKARAAPTTGRRYLTKHDLLYLVLVRDFEKLLSKHGKELIYKAVRRSWPSNGELTVKAPDPLLKLLDFKKARSEMRGQLGKLTKAKAMVASDPEIRGGEPVIKGTRIGVYEVATMLERGAGKEELLSGYPTLKPEHLELAVIYATAYPRRGRPPRHPWHRSPVALPD